MKVTAKGGTGSGGEIKASSGLNVSASDGGKPKLVMGPNTLGPRSKDGKGTCAIAKEVGKSMEAKGNNCWDTGLIAGNLGHSQFGLLDKGKTAKVISEADGLDVRDLFSSWMHCLWVLVSSLTNNICFVFVTFLVYSSMGLRPMSVGLGLKKQM